MKVLITGICGFVGSSLAKAFIDSQTGWKVFGVDNLTRPGSELNRSAVRSLGVTFIHGDLRSASDVDNLPVVDWIIDAAANPSVLAGADGSSTSRQLMEHNLFGTVNLLEYCKLRKSGLVLLSTSRVYSIVGLSSLPMISNGLRFQPDPKQLPPHCTPNGIEEGFSTAAPISLYGATKLASEALALEYGKTFGFPVLINRCGVLAGAGQFGRPDQGIFAFWINSHLRRAPLRYIGYEGKGYQVRDCLHPRDLASLVRLQIEQKIDTVIPPVLHVSGGFQSATSLLELTEWCNNRFGPCKVDRDPRPRPFDLPWVVLDSAVAQKCYAWAPQISKEEIFEEIATHALAHPQWLSLSASE